ncbi:MAG: hypothetical protein LBD81_00485 [Holosporaceae bacterium]|nr:hypothetical protein [Holosporaceae bacterium]
MTYQEITEELHCVEKTAGVMIKRLCDLGILKKRQLATKKWDRRMYYTIDERFIFACIEDEKTTVSIPPKTTVSIRTKGCDHIKDIINLNKSNKSKIENGHKFKSGLQICTDRPKPTIVQDMTKIWREEFPHSPIVFSQRLCKFLVSAFQRKFNRSLEKWREYLRLIKSSAYLMGERFKIWISNMLRFETIDRIFNGEFGVKKEYIQKTEKELLTEALFSLENTSESEECVTIRRRALQKHGPATYLSWLSKVSLKKDGVLKVCGSSRFVLDYVTRNFLGEFGECVAVEY